MKKINKKIYENKFEEGNNNLEFISLVKKTKIRGTISGLIIGAIVTGSISVAAVTLTANQIKYTPTNEKFTATNVEEALNEIYKISEYEIPEDTYFYEEGTEENSYSIVRYKKINDEYFMCDAYGKIEEDATAIDITSKTLIPYAAASPENLTAGSAGFASNSFILGDGKNTGGGSSMTITYQLVGDQTETFYCDKPVTVTLSGTLSSHNYGSATLKLGDIETFSATGKSTNITLSGTYSLPAGSTITLSTTFNGTFSWDSMYSSGKAMFGTIVATLEIKEQ